MDWRTISGILGIALAVTILVSLLFHRKREKELEKIIAGLMEQQDGAKLPGLEKSGEGNLGILQSEIYKMAVRLGSQWDMAESEKKYLSDLLSDISHQIKTPLAAITIMTDLLKNPELSAEKRMEFVSNIDRETERITWLVKNLLALSRLEAGVLKLKSERISVKALLENVLKSFEMMAEVKDVTLGMEAPPEIFLTCDIHWTAEALSNIVKNCLEHTPPGGFVKVRAEQNNFSTNIQIRDNGTGISGTDMPHIFERFYRTSASGDSSVGIGLAMSKQIFLLQGATVSAKSEVGNGTEFFIKFYPAKIV